VYRLKGPWGKKRCRGIQQIERRDIVDSSDSLGQDERRRADAAGLGQIGLLLRCVSDVLDSPFCSVGRICDILASASYGVSASDSRQRSDEQCDCRQLPEFHRSVSRNEISKVTPDKNELFRLAGHTVAARLCVPT
jgi:hypothetical protein